MEFENYNLRIENINKLLQKYDIKCVEECNEICIQYGLDVQSIIKGIQSICFDDAVCAYTISAAICLKNKISNLDDIANKVGEALQSFCIAGSVSDIRQIGIGHGNLAAKLLSEDTKCFCFVAGHESFAAAEGAIAIALNANKVRTTPLKVVLNGLGKDAAYIIARINGFSYNLTQFDHATNKLSVLKTTKFSNTQKGDVVIYGANDVFEGVAIMQHEKVDVSITGNSTNPVRFQHPVCATYKKICNQENKKYFAVASGGGTGRTLHPDNVAAGPASYGLTDTMGRMYCDVQFAGSSSVPAHVEMMGFIGMGNNPIVGATISIIVAVKQLLNK